VVRLGDRRSRPTTRTQIDDLDIETLATTRRKSRPAFSLMPEEPSRPQFSDCDPGRFSQCGRGYKVAVGGDRGTVQSERMSWTDSREPRRGSYANPLASSNRTTRWRCGRMGSSNSTMSASAIGRPSRVQPIILGMW
jgi:hypothetical protein